MRPTMGRGLGGERRVLGLMFDSLVLSPSRSVAKRRRLSELWRAGVFSLLLVGVASGCVGVGAGRSNHILTPASPPASFRSRFLPLS